MKKLYEEWIDPQKSFNKRIMENKLVFETCLEYAQEIMILMEYFKYLPKKLKFFDFGMGWGRWCLIAKAFGCDVYGNELSDTKITYVKGLGIKVITYNKIPKFQFDFINTEQVFEHIPNPLETLQHLIKSLNRYGLIKISVPDGSDIKRNLKILNWKAPKGSKDSLNPVSPLEHINCYNRNSIIKMADKVGLELVNIPIKTQLAYTLRWNSLRSSIANILKPIRKNIFNKGTYLFFRLKE